MAIPHPPFAESEEVFEHGTAGASVDTGHSRTDLVVGIEKRCRVPGEEEMPRSRIYYDYDALNRFGRVMHQGRERVEAQNAAALLVQNLVNIYHTFRLLLCVKSRDPNQFRLPMLFLLAMPMVCRENAEYSRTTPVPGSPTVATPRQPLRQVH